MEFYLARLVDAPLALDAMGGPGNPPAAPQVTPLAPGYAYQSEDHLDQIEGVLAVLADNLLGAGLPLRTMEDEWGPGQCEFTFSPMPGLAAADAMLLFRAATKQVARRLGLHATFMCRPALPSFYASGWHLHQSLVDAAGVNVFATPDDRRAAVADRAPVRRRPARARRRRLGVHHAHPERLPPPSPFSLAPNRSTWGLDNRAAMLRVQGGPGDRSTHVENRVGEPAANPYLYLASQLIAGMDGLARELDPGAPEVEPYAAEHRPLLPADPDGRGQGPRRQRAVPRRVRRRVRRLAAAASSGSRSTDSPPPRAPGIPTTSSQWEHREYFAQY